MATAVIGDVHGNFQALDDLLTQLGPLLTAKDTAVFLGDYIDRGPGTRGCIDRILRWKEESPATVVTLIERVVLPYGLLLEAMPPSHLDFLRALKLYHRTEDALCVHGGLDPAIPDVVDQPREALLWGTHDFPDGYSGDEMVVYGHWGNAVLDRDGWPRPCIRDRTIGVDTIAHGVLLRSYYLR